MLYIYFAEFVNDSVHLLGRTDSCFNLLLILSCPWIAFQFYHHVLVLATLPNV